MLEAAPQLTGDVHCLFASCTGYLALVIAACVMNFHRALPLFVITVVAIFFVVWDHCMAKYESQIARFLSPGQRLLDSHWFWLKW